MIRTLIGHTAAYKFASLAARGRIIWVIAALSLAALAFLAGIAIGYRQAPPFPQMQAAYHALNGRVSGRPTAVQELMGEVFSQPLVAGRIHPVITSPAGVKAANQSIFVDVRSFPTAYEKLRLQRVSILNIGSRDVLKVDFELARQRYEAYAYAVGRSLRPAQRRRVGVLIIPGTGVNMASKILNRTGPGDGRTAISAFSGPDRDLFVLIKPNEDALAFHNGEAKMHFRAIGNYQLNRGGSYGASYIVQSLAITKYLQSVYGEVAVAGLSQGGSATLLNALQSKPNVAVIASGYTVVGSSLELADFYQLVIPGYWNSIAPVQLASSLTGLPTDFLFTWGKQDTPIYRLDAETGATCKALRSAANVKCVFHDGSHEYPVPLIQAFLELKLGSKGPPSQ